MATVTTHVNAAPEAVFAVLSDGWVYAQWVVGSSHVRAVDSGWPAAGTKLHHAVGAWPLIVRDHTQVQEVELNHRMLMTARGWPFGEAEVELVVEGERDGTRFTIREEATGGAGRLMRNSLGDKLIHRRNVESAARLAALVERRTVPADGA